MPRRTQATSKPNGHLRTRNPLAAENTVKHMAELKKALERTRGGELRVESELGKGSTFKIVLPGVKAVGKELRIENGKCKTKEESSSILNSTFSTLHSSFSHVLVVDDSAVNRSVLTAFTKRAGIVSVGHACDGIEAFAELESAAKAGNPYDFVFSDFWMPNMNGLEFIEKLRADSRFCKLPVFALTADTEIHGDSRTGLFTGVLIKPMTFDKLVDAFTSAERLKG